MRWQKWARFLVATIGIAAAVAVYATMGERAKSIPATAPTRIDPKAIIESSGNIVQQVRGARQDYLIEAERQLTYEGGLTKLVGVKITVRNRGGRDYVVTGREAQAAGSSQQDLQLTGGVQLSSNDGFIVRADTASFSQQTGLMTAPGAVTFERNRMTGSGTGMSYDKNADVLSLADQSHVLLRDEHGNPQMEFTSGKSTFDRMAHTLALEGNVHALRDQQVIDATQGFARLTEDEQHITDIELRGSSRVVGGGAGVDAMSARDMNLHYSADGQVLEHAELLGDGAVAMTGQGGASGRQVLGDTLDIALAADGSITKVMGRDNVRLDLPGAPDSPARSIKARTLDGDGAPGKGLTAATFADNVEYREESGKTSAARVARSRTLTVALTNDAISSAVFGGAVKFEEQGLQAAGGEARYDPMKGSLRLTGVEGGVVPRVSDDQVTIDANVIDVGLEGRLMKASGGVKTMLRASKSKLPGLLKQDQPANVNADALDYQGASGQAIYTGNATMWQGETAVRADSVAIDQSKGDFVASGNARSTIVLDTGVSIAHAAEIRYADAAHTIRYTSTRNALGVVIPQAQLSGPQGDLRADRIEVLLAEKGGHIDRLEAYTNVSMKLDTRTAAGERLTYFADEERYVMSGAGTKSVKVIEACRETIGRTLTFFKATDRIIVDGNEEIRTQTRNGASPACTAAPPLRSR
jgi:LPS export ABC transporter protein LptC